MATVYPNAKQLVRREYFTASGTYTKKSDVSSIIVEVIGGGGGGYNTSTGVTNGSPWIKVYCWRAEYGALFDVE